MKKVSRAQRRWLGAALLTTLGTFWLAPASATTVLVEHKNCRGVQAELRVPAANVEPLLPDGFIIAAIELGSVRLADVVLLTAQCDDVLIGGQSTGQTLEAALRLEIQDPDGGDGESFHYFQLWLASDNADLIQEWRRSGAETGRGAVLAEELSARFEGLDTSPTFTFAAPAPTPSPFTLVADLRPAVLPASVSGDVWAAVPRGILKQGPERVEGLFGLARGKVSAEPGSQLDRMLCGHSDGSFTETSDSLSVSLSNSYTIVGPLLTPASRPAAICT